MVTAERYWLGDSPPEVEHLLRQAEVYAAEADELLDRIGLAEGASAIDVACGAFGILPLLRSRVGDSGRVVGLDLEPALLAVARQLADQHGLKIETVQADATGTGLPADAFDLVHERTLLLNIANPQDVVAEMTRLARPGGIVALQEPDSSSWVCDPPHPAWELLCGELINVYARSGKNFEIGRQAARLLRAAGLSDVQVRATALATVPGEYYHTFLLTLTGLLREQILGGGSVTGDQFDSGTAELAEHLSTPGALTCQPIMWQAWGTKP